MKTNYQIATEIAKNFKPEKRGLINHKEINQLKIMMELEGKTALDLQNLRDFLVMFLGIKKDHFRDEAKEVDVLQKTVENDAKTRALWEKHDDIVDQISAVTAILDACKFKLEG